MPDDREALLVQKTFKFYVIQNGRRVVKTFQPGEFLPRSDWDREATGRSKRTMTNVGFVRDPVPPELHLPQPKPSVTVVGLKGYDRKATRSAATGVMAVVDMTATQTAPLKRKRGRPRKVKV